VIAEIKNKKVDIGSEDQLTGNVFGALRYLPYPTVRQILIGSVTLPGIEKVLPESLPDDKNGGWGKCVRFWPHYEDNRTEPDVILELGEVIVMIEAKYMMKTLSGDKQLMREAHLLDQKYRGKTQVLIILAKEECAHSIYRDNVTDIRNKYPYIMFGCATWQNLLDVTSAHTEHSIVCADIADLLRKKGLERFRGFRGMNNDTLKAFQTVRAAHKDVELFIKRCVEIADDEESRFCLAPMTSNITFLRRNSDIDYSGWAYSSFILVFQDTEGKPQEKSYSDWWDGPLYVLEINFEKEFYDKPTDEPVANITRYDFAEPKDWLLLSPSEHALFYDPLYRDDYGYDDSQTKYAVIFEPPLQKYANLKSVIGYETFLSEITPENISEKIFGGFEELANVDDPKSWII
jgi:hypothetical protein